MPSKGGTLQVLWDSGQGLNNYEARQFTIDAAGISSTIPIEIRYTGIKDQESSGSSIVCRRITADGRRIKLDAAARGSFRKNREGDVVLARRGDYLRVEAQTEQHLQIELATNRFSGKARIIAFGRSKIVDLYTDNREIKKRLLNYWLASPDGRFTVSMNLPRYAVKRLVIRRVDRSRPLFLKSAVIRSRRGVVRLPVQTAGVLDKIGFRDVNRSLKAYFDPVRFFFQVIFSAMSTWIVVTLLSRMKACGGLRAIFLGEKRYIFWGLFIGAVAVFSFWLIAFWPGVMSVDSLKIWRAAKLPDVTIGNHPAINVVFYMYLMQIWDNSAVVPMAQIGLTALLGAWIVFSLYRRGLPLLAVVLFYLPFIFSIPVGLYNCTLWKDIPFALLVVFWAYTLGDMYQKKKQGILKFSAEKLLALGLLFVAVAFTRFNGMVYLVVLPVLLIFMRIISFRRFAAGLFACIFAAGAVYFFMHGNSAFKNMHYVSQQSSRLFKELKEEPANRQLKQFARNYFGIFNINQKVSRWDLWHYFLKDRYAYTFLRQSGWGDVYPYVNSEKHLSKRLYALGMKLYRWSSGNPQVYLAWNPFYLLVFFPFFLLLYRYLPQSALFSAVITVQVFTLLFLLKILNWRYYYFAYLGCFFLVPVGTTELMQKMRTAGKKAPVV